MGQLEPCSEAVKTVMTTNYPLLDKAHAPGQADCWYKKKSACRVNDKPIFAIYGKHNGSLPTRYRMIRTPPPNVVLHKLHSKYFLGVKISQHFSEKQINPVETF